MTSSARRWVTGVGLASGAAVAAAVVATAGAPTALADDGSLTADLGLLDSVQSNVVSAFALAGHTDTVVPDLISKFDAIQTPLLSSDNSFVSGVGELLFNGSDQQLAQSSEAFLVAAETLAGDPSSATGIADYASAGLQFSGALLFDSLPANVTGALIDRIIDPEFPSTTSAGAATDVSAGVAALATAVTGSPSDVISQAIGDLNQGAALLDAAPTADLSARQLDLLTGQEGLTNQLTPLLTQIGAQQDNLAPGDQVFLADANEQFVSAAQNVLSAEQAFAAADQAGQLGGSGFLPADFAIINADLGLFSADLNALGATILAALDPNLDALIPTDVLAAVDPSTLTDVLSSIGL